MKLDALPILVIPDLHGKFEILQQILNKFPNHHVLFMGDFLDSYDLNSLGGQENCLKNAIELAQTGEATLLMGNHEASYFLPGQRCSGYRSITQTIVDSYRESYLKVVKLFAHIEWNNKTIIATHGGVSHDFLRAPKGAVITELQRMEESNWQDPRIFEVGYYRGGNKIVGGPLWCDYWNEFSNIEGLIQLMGHSRHREQERGIIYKKGENSIGINLDCLDTKLEFLLINEEGFFIYDLDTGEIEQFKSI